MITPMIPNNSFKMNSVKLKINDIDFNITEFFGEFGVTNRIVDSFTMVGNTSNQNLMLLDKWFNECMQNKNYKKNIILNSIKIYGIFPMDYNFTHYGINVTFSIDYLEGNLKLFNIRKLRKEKLEKIFSNK